MFCPVCGSVITEEKPKFCPHCGADFEAISKEPRPSSHGEEQLPQQASPPVAVVESPTQQPASPAKVSETQVGAVWYLLPILLGIIGGLIGYLVVRDRNPRTAGRLLAVGLVMTLAYVGLALYANQLVLQRLGLVGPSTSAVDLRGAVTFGQGDIAVYIVQDGSAQAQVHYIGVYQCPSATDCQHGGAFLFYAWPCAPGDMSVSCVTQQNSGQYYDQLAFTTYQNGTEIPGQAPGNAVVLSPGASANFTLPFAWQPNTTYFVITSDQPAYPGPNSTPYGWMVASPSS